MNKQYILDEIKRTAAAHGVPLGRTCFQVETEIKQSDWYGKYWRSRGEAVTEVGYPAHQLQKAFGEDYV